MLVMDVCIKKIKYIVKDIGIFDLLLFLLFLLLLLFFFLLLWSSSLIVLYIIDSFYHSFIIYLYSQFVASHAVPTL